MDGYPNTSTLRWLVIVSTVCGWNIAAPGVRNLSLLSNVLPRALPALLAPKYWSTCLLIVSASRAVLILAGITCFMDSYTPVQTPPSALMVAAGKSYSAASFIKSGMVVNALGIWGLTSLAISSCSTEAIESSSSSEMCSGSTCYSPTF